MDCLITGSKVFTEMNSEREPFITLLHSLVDNWRQIKGCIKIAGSVPESMNTNTKSHLFRLAERLSKEGYKEIVKFLVVYFIGGAGMTLIIVWLNNELNIDYKASWIGGAIFAIVNNYLGSKYIVFKKHKKGLF